MIDEQAKFEGWAIVEIFGHQRYAGFVTTQAFGQAVMFRVEVPPLAERERVSKHYEYIGDKSIPPGSTVKESAVPGYTKLFGVGAIYAITPCDEAAAVKATEASITRKLQLVRLAETQALPERTQVIATCARCGKTFLTSAPLDEIDPSDLRCSACTADEEREDEDFGPENEDEAEA